MLKNDPKRKKKILTSLKKSRSLIDKIIQMVEENEYCIDVMQQNLAAMGLIRSAHNTLMKSHLNTCFKNAMDSEDEKLKQKMIEEILKVNSLNDR